MRKLKVSILCELCIIVYNWVVVSLFILGLYYNNDNLALIGFWGYLISGFVFRFLKL